MFSEETLHEKSETEKTDVKGAKDQNTFYALAPHTAVLNPPFTVENL